MLPRDSFEGCTLRLLSSAGNSSTRSRINTKFFERNSSVCCEGASVKVSRRSSATQCCRFAPEGASAKTTMRHCASRWLLWPRYKYSAVLLPCLGGFVLARVSLHFDGSAFEVDLSLVASPGGNFLGSVSLAGS